MPINERNVDNFKNKLGSTLKKLKILEKNYIMMVKI